MVAGDPAFNRSVCVSFRAHPSSVVEDGARLGEGVVIGPFCHIGSNARIDDGVELASHVVVAGETHIGARTKIFPFATLGMQSQDLKSRDDLGRLRIGSDCIIREGVTINLGAGAGGGETRIGDNCAFLANSHVAHDCRVGDGVVLSNGVLLGGHVRLGDYVMIGGGAVVHQYVRVGAHAFVAGLSGLEGDLAPYGLAGGNRAHLFGLNVVGLSRRGFSIDRIARLREAYRLLFGFDRDAGESVFAERIDDVARDFANDEDVAILLAFLREKTSRPLCAPRRRTRS
jgi:UDP-N-acetylglucosamine acyltransferase